MRSASLPSSAGTMQSRGQKTGSGKRALARPFFRQRRTSMPRQGPLLYQDNAAKFKHNDELTRSRQRRLEEAGAFRAPTNAQRSFQPQYGAVREVSSYDSMTVRATDGSETLLKQALPVPRGSGEPVARLTRRPVPLAVRQLRDFNPGSTAP